MRGKVLLRERVVADAGITPACAGKSSAGEFQEARSEDHPRVCGEKPIAVTLRPIRTGSPPRVRGKVHGIRTILEGCRITPACAGKSFEGGIYEHKS